MEGGSHGEDMEREMAPSLAGCLASGPSAPTVS